MRMTKDYIASLKERYPAGTRVVVEFMCDTRPVKPGTRGTVRIVDDMGTVHVDWDSGRRLGLIPGEDVFYECVD